MSHNESLDLKVVIPSKGRSQTILEESLVLFPEALVTVDEAEVDDYLKVLPESQVVAHPGRKELPNLASIHNWIHEHIEAESIVTADDDMLSVTCLVGWRPRRYRDPVVVRQLLESSAICARDAGCGMFGYNLSPSPKFFKPDTPFRLNVGIGQVHGYIRGHGLRWDQQLQFFGDMDVTLSSLIKHRIIWSDQRWLFVGRRLTNAGGLSGQRSMEAYAAAQARVDEKWGQYLKHSKGKDGEISRDSVIKVPRTQPGIE